MLSGRKDRRELLETLRRNRNKLCRTAATEGRRKALDLAGSL